MATTKTPVPSDVMEEFNRFLEFHSASRLSRNLRRFLWTRYNATALEAIYLKDLLYDLDGLFGVLDKVEEVNGNDADDPDKKP